MADSSFYVGVCADCNAVLRYVHAQNSAQGYSGTNAGGHLIVEDSEWDANRSGIVPSSLANDDPPSPQDGACPNQATISCTLIQRNYLHDNNNPNTPTFGVAATTAIGTGIELSTTFLRATGSLATRRTPTWVTPRLPIAPTTASSAIATP